MRSYTLIISYVQSCLQNQWTGLIGSETKSPPKSDVNFNLRFELLPRAKWTETLAFIPTCNTCLRATEMFPNALVESAVFVGLFYLSSHVTLRLRNPSNERRTSGESPWTRLAHFNDREDNRGYLINYDKPRRTLTLGNKLWTLRSIEKKRRGLRLLKLHGL